MKESTTELMKEMTERRPERQYLMSLEMRKYCTVGWGDVRAARLCKLKVLLTAIRGNYTTLAESEN